VIADSSYAPLAHVNAGNGMSATPRVPADRPRTALLTTYLVTHRDCVRRRLRGRLDPGRDLPGGRHRDGRVLLEWHSLDHIPITDSYWGLGTDWDYVP